MIGQKKISWAKNVMWFVCKSTASLPLISQKKMESISSTWNNQWTWTNNTLRFDWSTNPRRVEKMRCLFGSIGINVTRFYHWANHWQTAAGPELPCRQSPSFHTSALRQDCQSFLCAKLLNPLQVHNKLKDSWLTHGKQSEGQASWRRQHSLKKFKAEPPPKSK